MGIQGMVTDQGDSAELHSNVQDKALGLPEEYLK